MKLCPQCAFIYEDVQKVCDMDGQELVAAPSPQVTQPASLPVRINVELPQSKPRARRVHLLAIAALLLATLFAAVFLVQLNWRPQQPGLIADQTGDLEVPPIALPSTSYFLAPIPAPASDQSPSADPSAEESTNDSASSEPELSHSRSGPASRLRSISSGSVSGNPRNSVLIHLTNGGIVRADEAWERKDGVWYKQGGVVTLLPRSRVRSIERTGSSQTATNNSTPRNRDLIAQNRPRAAKTEVVTVKKESRVGSFLKKTGRILKKPFKF